MTFSANTLRSFISFILISFCFPVNIATAMHKTTVGIIVPLEHEAMAQIVSGIRESFQNSDVEFVVQNAQGDQNIMLSIIKQMADQDIDLIMPIGMIASQMTIAHIKDKPVVAVAAKVTIKSDQVIASINDEVPITSSINKLPQLTNIAVIFSSSEKIAPEIEELKEYAKAHNVTLHLAMIQTLADLPIAIRNSPENIQAFLILKDHLVISGLNILIQEANKRVIPIIASDEGSVIKGATLAIGVREKEIGAKSGQIAKDILAGKLSSGSFSITDALNLFVNTKSFAKQHLLQKKELQRLSLPIIEFAE